MDTDSKALREALQAATIRYSRDRGEPDPTPAFPFEVVFTMPQWEVLQKALATAPASPAGSGASGQIWVRVRSFRKLADGYEVAVADVDGDTNRFDVGFEDVQPQPPAAVPSDLTWEFSARSWLRLNLPNVVANEQLVMSLAQHMSQAAAVRAEAERSEK